MVDIKNAILLAGGEGTRMRPFTQYVSKSLLNVGGKPIIDYSLNTLKQMGVENLTVIVGSSFSGQILDYIKDGSNFGLNVNFLYQPKPNGIAFAVNLAQRFVADSDQFVLCLADNLFLNPIQFIQSDKLSQIVLCKHQELKRFGVASIKNNQIVKIEEKPKEIDQSLDNYAITGCYLFDQKFFEYFKQIVPSLRHEYEVAHIIDLYNKNGELGYIITDPNWVDCGTIDSISIANKMLGF